MDNSNKYSDIQDNWEKHEAYLTNLCRYKLKGREECVEDCVQDIYVAYRQALINGVDIRDERAWLTIVARNKISDVLRTEMNKDKKFVEYNAENVSLCDDEPYEVLIYPPTEEILEIKERVLALYLPEERGLLEDKYTHNMSNEELAEKYNTSKKNISVKICRLKKKVIETAKKEIKKYFSE